jgi:streptogramin lyase
VRTEVTKSACSIPKTEKFQEWVVPTPDFFPYDVTADRNGEVWAVTEFTDSVLRLDPQGGQIVEYLFRRGNKHAPIVCGQFEDAGHSLGG